MLDSPTSYKNSILIATANDVSVFPKDDPVRRSRRLSRWYEIEKLSTEQLQKMCRFLYGPEVVDAIINSTPRLFDVCHRRISGAELFEAFDMVDVECHEKIVDVLIDFLNIKKEKVTKPNQ